MCGDHTPFGFNVVVEKLGLVGIVVVWYTGRLRGLGGGGSASWPDRILTFE